MIGGTTGAGVGDLNEGRLRKLKVLRMLGIVAWNAVS